VTCDICGPGDKKETRDPMTLPAASCAVPSAGVRPSVAQRCRCNRRPRATLEVRLLQIQAPVELENPGLGVPICSQSPVRT
jgi:hypothetical protein